MIKFMTESASQKDGFAFAILGIALLVAGWKTSILFSQTTRRMEMERFQLASSSWTTWALLAPVPSMYNFENRIQFTNRGTFFKCPVNHFPARCITFGEFAPTWFEKNRDGTFEMSTMFREHELTSVWTIEPQADGLMYVRRKSETWVDHDAE